MKNASIIIAGYNGEKFISDCLESVLKSTNLNYEIIFINDGSTDNTQNVLNKYRLYKNIKIINFKKNKGASTSRNFGAKIADGKYLVFLDVDCIVKKNSLMEIIKPLEKDKSIGMTQGLLLNQDESIESAGHFLTFFGFPYNLREIPNSKQIFGARTTVAIRRELFEKIGGYDEDYKIYGEDTDLSWRTWLAGYSINLVAEAKIYHLKKSSFSKETQLRIFYEGAKNQTINILKNSSLLQLSFMLPLHTAAWLTISIKLLLQGRLTAAFGIYRGLFWNLSHFINTMKKRSRIDKFARDRNLKSMMFGSINVVSWVSKGWRWFSHV